MTEKGNNYDKALKLSNIEKGEVHVTNTRLKQLQQDGCIIRKIIAVR